MRKYEEKWRKVETRDREAGYAPVTVTSINKFILSMAWLSLDIGELRDETIYGKESILTFTLKN